MRSIIKLQFINELHQRLAAQSGLIQVLLGPRQVGKTTSVLQYLQDTHPQNHYYVSADSVLNAGHEWLREQWEVARRKTTLLVIDEIQKCENWAATIKALWDEDKRKETNIDCILLGSSSLSIQQGLSESLTGRFQLTTAYHWNAKESYQGYKLSFDDYLKFGGYPGSYDFSKNDEWRRYVETSIITTVVEKDILQYHSIKSPALFKQAFEIIMGYPAMEISYTKLLGQLQNKGNTDLIKHYLELYQGAYLLRVLEKFSPSRIKVKSSSPKILPLAPCLYYLTHLGELSSEEKGHIFEAVVGAQLVRTGENLYYWRDGKHEVDFVVQRGKQIWAIEVKSGRRKRLGGLEIFKQRFPEARLCIVSTENYPQFEKDPISFLQG